MKPLRITLNVYAVRENTYMIKYVVNEMDETLINRGGVWETVGFTPFYKDETKNMCILSASFPEIRVCKTVDEDNDNYKLLLFVLGNVMDRNEWLSKELTSNEVVYILDNVYGLVSGFNKSIGHEVSPIVVLEEGICL